MVWTTAYINDLPDSSFAYISPDGTRHLPFKDKEGNVDAAHLRNALARLNQTDIPAEAKASALAKLKSHSKAAGVDTQEADEDEMESDNVLAETGWTDEARAASLEARRAKVRNHEQNPYHKVLTQHGFVHQGTAEKQNRFAPNNPEAGYTEHVYAHPEHGRSQVIVTQDHAKTGPYKNDPLDSWRLHHEQSNGIMAPTTGSTKPQLHRELTYRYGTKTRQEALELVESVDLVEARPSGSIKHGKINRAMGVIEGATMIGPMSTNGANRKRRYSTNALKKIAQEGEGLPGYLNHVKPEDAFKPRDVRDIAVRHRNVRYDPTTDSVKSDMYVMPNHADLVFALAENFGDHIGNSLVSKGAVTMEGDTEVVQDILALRSADLVTDPASTKGLFEGAESRERSLSIADLIESIKNTEVPTVGIAEILSHLKGNEKDLNLLAEHFGWVVKDSAEKLQESNKTLTAKVAEMEKALIESSTKLAASEKTLTETKVEVDTYKAKEAVAAKQAKLQEAIAAHGLSKEFGKVKDVISESFVTMLESQDESQWSKTLDDRYAALKSVPRGQSPKSEPKDLSESSTGLPSDIYARVAAMVGR